MNSISIEQVKQYNDSLKVYRDKASKLNAEIEYVTRDINALCVELSNELGVTVTPENLDKIYQEEVGKINTTLQSGLAVLNKIATEEKAVTTVNKPTQTVDVPQPAPVAPAAPVAPVAPGGFGTITPVDGSSLPSFFNN